MRHRALVVASNGLVLVFLMLLASLILTQVFREGPTTSHRIMGAVAVYLILGVIWSLAYYLIALWSPEAFIVHGAFTAGDIVAVHPMARMLVILEGVAGQLFPAILIARLVSLYRSR